MQVTSGIDWFDLEGHADYGGQQVSLPALLAALRRGDGFVQLGDGTMGLLPEAWLQKHGMLASFASPEGERLRFRSSQVALLDALLAERPEATCGEAFTRARAELRVFDGIAPVDPPASFTGTLRGYQREGLGWLLFLQRFGSAAAWPTTWAWARRLWCWPCSRRSKSHHERRARGGRRSSWRPVR